jgi:hypothetical protein
VLQLTADQSAVVDAYVDDSVEPLKSLVARWKAAIVAEGRVPF